VRAAVLQPISFDRAELLGVEMASTSAEGADGIGGYEVPAAAAAAEAAAALTSPSRRALRSLFQE